MLSCYSVFLGVGSIGGGTRHRSTITNLSRLNSFSLCSVTSLSGFLSGTGGQLWRFLRGSDFCELPFKESHPLWCCGDVQG